jgi:outer membrane receptor for ferrienterochelin and colicins
MKCMGMAAATLLAAGLGTTAWADPSSDEAEQAALLAVLQQETDIATKTRMNSDFVPGIVTLLDGEKLRALGARSVWDAMPYVPGVHATLDAFGAPTVVVRGIQFPFNSGSIQILLNGVPIGREAAGTISSLLFLPMVQVERLEFIRGPGSVLYGDFAFQGLLNIVTRSHDNEVSLEADNRGAQQLSLITSGKVGGWDGTLNLAAKDNGDAIAAVGNAAEDRNFSGMGSLSRGGLQLRAQMVQRHVDDTDGHGNDLSYAETDASADVRYDVPLAENAASVLRAQYLHNDISNLATAFKGDQWRVGYDVSWNRWSRQNWVAGVEYTHGDIDRAVPPPGPVLPGQPAHPAPILGDLSNHVASVYLQDQIEILPTLRTTLGMRYDETSESGGHITPRASLVWQAAEHHLLKLQYAEGTRAPTFFELYTGRPQGGHADLDFEINRTAEINYVYERPNLTARATLFRTRIDDMVFAKRPPPGFGNVANARAKGAEVELTQQIGKSWRLDANLSYVQAQDNRDGPLVERDLTEAPHWMGNVGLLWTPAPDWVCSLHWNYIGKREAVQQNDGHYDLVDLSVTKRHLFNDTVDAQLAVNNLFDRRVTQISSLPNQDVFYDFKDRVVWGRVTVRW